jgi:hypothetical protein
MIAVKAGQKTIEEAGGDKITGLIVSQAVPLVT